MPKSLDSTANLRQAHVPPCNAKTYPTRPCCDSSLSSTAAWPGGTTYAPRRADIHAEPLRGVWTRPEPFIGRLALIAPGISIEWTLRQDMRDMRRFHALDLDGQSHGHATPKELLHRLADSLPRYCVLGE